MYEIIYIFMCTYIIIPMKTRRRSLCAVRLCCVAFESAVCARCPNRDVRSGCLGLASSIPLSVLAGRTMRSWLTAWTREFDPTAWAH